MAYKDKEKERACRKRWVEEHKDLIKERQHRWYEEHKDQVKERSKRWEAEHPDKVAENRRKQNAKVSWRERCYKYLDLEHWRWEDVEGYDGWTTNVVVHHRREGIGYTRAQLIEQGQYYKCRADELICVTKAEHARIHHEIDKFFHRGKYKD